MRSDLGFEQITPGVVWNRDCMGHKQEQEKQTRSS